MKALTFLITNRGALTVAQRETVVSRATESDLIIAIKIIFHQGGEKNVTRQRARIPRVSLNIYGRWASIYNTRYYFTEGQYCILNIRHFYQLECTFYLHYRDSFFTYEFHL